MKENILFENGLKSIARILTSCFDCDVRFSPKAKTASIAKTKSGSFLITLPALEAVKVTNEQKRIINGYTDHEIFHGNYTDMDWSFKFSKKNPNVGKLISLLDEARIENLGGRKYVGSVKNLKAMNDFITDGLLTRYTPDGGEGDLLTGLIWYGIDHNYFSKLSSKVGHVKPYLDMVTDLVSTAKRVETIQELQPIAEEIIKRWHQQKKEEEKNQNQEEEKQEEENENQEEQNGSGGEGENEEENQSEEENQNGGGSGDDENESEEQEDGSEEDNAPSVNGNGDGDKEEDEEGEENEDGNASGKGEEKDGEESDEEENGNETVSGKGEEDGDTDEEDLTPEQMGEELFGRNDADDNDANSSENIARVIIEELIEQLIEEDLGESYRPVREFDAVVDYKGNDKSFLKELAKRGTKYQAIKTQLHRCITIEGQDHWNKNLRSGKIDYNSLYRLTEAIDTDIWKEHKQGQVFDTAVTIMIDGSGSMSSFWLETRELVKNIANMLNGKADLEVLIQDTNGRCSDDSKSSEEVYRRYGNGYNRYQPSIVRVLKGFDDGLECLSSIDNFTTKDNAIENEALKVATNRILARPNKRKIIFSVTDGYPRSDYEHDDTYALLRDLKYTVDEIMEKTDIELIALGIGSEGSSAVKEYYPEWVEVDSMETLAKKGMQKLTKILKRGLRGKARTKKIAKKVAKKVA